MRWAPPRGGLEGIETVALREQLIVRTAWLLAATSVILGVAAWLHLGPLP